MKTMNKRVLIFLALYASVLSGAQAQNLVPQPIPCLLINQNDVNGFSGLFNTFNCIVSEDASGPVVIDGPEEVEMKAGEEIVLKGETYVQSGGELHAYIEKSPIEVVWYTPNTSVGVAHRYEKLELGFKLDPTTMQSIENYVNDNGNPRINPFNPNEIDFWAEFEYRLNGNWVGPARINGFYYREFQRNIGDPLDASTQSWMTDTTSYPLRVRVSPPATGEWRVKIKVQVAGQPLKETYYIYFNCIDNGAKPYIRVGANKRYFTQGNETFFPVGQNLRWPVWDASISESEPFPYPPQAYLNYHQLMSELKNSGANYFRMLIAPWNLDIEFEELGNYSDRMNYAWEMDKILEKANDLDLYIHLNLQLHFPFEVPNIFANWRFDWIDENDPRIPPCATFLGDQGHCYFRELGITNPEDFLTNPTAKDFYKKRLRYISARWGYSTNIAVLELFSEINNLGNEWEKEELPQDPCSGEVRLGCWNTAVNCDEPSYRPYANPSLIPIFGNWQDEMCGYLKSINTPQLLAVNYTGEPDLNLDGSFYSSNVDVITWNQYQTTVNNALFFQENKSRYVNAFQIEKPYMHSEIGQSITGCDNNNAAYLTYVWSGAFSGLAGTPIFWADQTPTAEWDHLGRLHQFVAGIDFNGEDWLPDNWDRNDELAYTVYLRKRSNPRKAAGVVVNRTYNYVTTSSPTDTACVGALLDFADNDIRSFINVTPDNGGNRLLVRNMGGWNRYTVEWYDALTGNPIGNPDQVWSNIWGRIRLDFPVLGNNAAGFTPVVAYKIRRRNQPSFLPPPTPDLTASAQDPWMFSHAEQAPTLDTITQENTLLPIDTVNNHVVSPNPATAVLQVVYSGPHETERNWMVYDANGIEVLHGNFTSPTEVIRIDNLPVGTYFLRIRYKETTEVHNFVKVP